MTMPQHEARERFLIDHINHGTSLIMRTLADATEALDDAIEFEDAMIPWQRKGDDPEAAVALTHLRKAHAEAMRRHDDRHRWADTLSEQLGAALLRLATGREDV